MGTKALARKEELPKDLPLAAIDYGEDAGQGFENSRPGELRLPFIALLQDLSPQVKGAGKVPGAEPGKLFNTVTNEVYDALEIIPAWHENCFVEWKPRKSGGGFVARHDVDSDLIKAVKAKAESGIKLTNEGNDVLETQYLYCVLALADGRLEPAVLGFTVTKLKVFRNWWTRVHMFTLPLENGRKVRPPIYAHRVAVSSCGQTNKAGQGFHNFVLRAAENDNIRASLLAVDDPRYIAAKDLQAMVRGGSASINYDAAAETEAGTGEGAF